jgi:hypothetical protein
MAKTALVKSLAAWAGTALRFGGEHCIETRPRFRIPGAGVADLLTLRHTPPSSAGRTDHFVVGLWSMESAVVEDAAVDAMTRRMRAFEAWYSELLEHAETQGFSSGHRISVCGNVVGRSIRRSPLLDLLSNWACALYFWTWKPAARGIELTPYYGKSSGLASARGQLKALLHHLPWQDTGGREEEADARALRRAAQNPSRG